MMMSLSTILTSSVLAFPSPLAGSSAQCAGPTHPFGAQIHPLSTFQTFEQAHAHLRQLVTDLRQRLGSASDLAALRDQIRLELERLRHFPDAVASDPSVDELFTEAMLVVAASVQSCDPDLAEVWVDRALARRDLASSPRARPDLSGLPDDFVTLYDERALALSTADPATIRIQCETACAVFVDAHPVPVVVGKVEAHAVVPGTHDIWIFHSPDGGAPATNSPTRVSVTELELDSGDQNCLSFPNPSYLGLLPSREEWWSAWSFAQRIDWAIETKKSLVNFETSIFEELVDASPVHARVLVHAPELRELRVRAALHLADLWQQAEQSDDANAVLDRILLWADLHDSPLMLAAAVGKFPGLLEPFEERVALRAARARGTIEVDCRRCLPAIDGVVIDADSFELPADRYRVELFPSSTQGEVRVFDDVVVRTNEITLLQTSVPRTHAVAPEVVDFHEGYRQNPQLQRWVWGTAGGLALAGGAVWSFALTTWLIPNLQKIGLASAGSGGCVENDNACFRKLRAPKAISIGLLVTGAFFLHAEIAAFFFSHMPPSRRPGVAPIAVGSGLLVSGLVTAGHAITAYLSFKDAREGPDASYPDDAWKYAFRQTASSNLGWAAVAATGALALSGTTLVALGVERNKIARRDGVVRPARVPYHQRPGVVPIMLGSGLLIAGASFVGLGVPALVLEPTDPSASALVGLVGGATLGLSGAVLVGVGAQRKRKHKRSSGSRAALVPSISPSALGFQLVGQF